MDEARRLLVDRSACEASISSMSNQNKVFGVLCDDSTAYSNNMLWLLHRENRNTVSQKRDGSISTANLSLAAFQRPRDDQTF